LWFERPAVAGGPLSFPGQALYPYSHPYSSGYVPGMATIRQRKRGVWEVRVFAGRDGKGKPVQISRTVYGGEKDAERVANELALKPARNAGRRTIEDLLGEWCELKDASWAPYSKRDQHRRARFIREDRIAKVPVARLQVNDVDQWIVRLRKAGVGESAISNRLQTLRAALSQAVRWGWISQNPAALATYERAKRTVCDVMSAEDVQRVMAAAETVNEMALVMLRLAAITGARRGELAALRWEDLDGAVLRIDSAISIVREGDGEDREAVQRDDPTKTGDRRRVALDEDTVRLLEPLRKKRERYAPWMFSDTEEAPRPDRLGYWWRRCRAIARISEVWRLHDMRDWSATQELSEGYDLATVAGRLGHSDPSTTLRVYAHARSVRDVELASSLGAALRTEMALAGEGVHDETEGRTAATDLK